MGEQTGRTGRRRGDSSSRAVIADAARRLFATRGFDGVSVRAIAAAAEVDPALVHYFFGTKQALFAELMQWPFDPAVVVPELLRGGTDGLGERVARMVIGQLRDPETGESIVALVRTAAAHPQAAAILRDRYTRELLEPLATGLDADQPELRAALCSSQLLGFGLAEHVIGLGPLVESESDTLARLLGATLQRYLTGPL